MKGAHKTKEQLINELAEMRQRRIAELEAADTERLQAEKKIQHLNLVLRAIRNVNQLIAKERDRDRLLQGTCETLIETRGYYHAWIALLDESEGPVTTAEAGLGKGFLPLVERLKHGELTDCGRRALRQSGGVVTEDPSSTCADCPLSSTYEGRGAATVRLEYGGKVYGLLSVSIPRDLAADGEEQALFEEVAGDIAFALHSVEQEEERKRAEKALRESEERFRLTVEATRDGLWENSFGHKRDFFSDRMFTMLGYEPMDPVHAFDFFNGLLHPDDVENFQKNYNAMNKPGHDDYSVEIRYKAKDGTWRHVLSRGKCIERDEKGRPVRIVGAHTDITDLKRAEEALRESEKRFRSIAETASDAIIIFDSHENIFFWNQAAQVIFGYRAGETRGRLLASIMPKRFGEVFRGKMKRVISTGESGLIGRAVEVIGIRKDGTEFPLELSLAPWKTREGIFFTIIARDITERKRAEEELAHMATHDALTGLPNRWLFNDRLTLELARAYRNRQKLAVMLLDLDHFKDVNDMLGHTVGDKLLQAVGKRLISLVRKSDTVARMGGDEFTLISIFPGIRGEEDAFKIARRILEAFRRPFAFDGHEVRITTSIGIAIYPDDGQDADTLMKSADTAMYRAKARGRDNYQRYSK